MVHQETLHRRNDGGLFSLLLLFLPSSPINQHTREQNLQDGVPLSKMVKSSSDMPKNAKYGGRQKGVPNRLNAEIKEVLSSFALDEIEYIKSNIHLLTLNNRVVFLSKVLPLVVTRNEVGVSLSGDGRTIPMIVFTNKE